MERTRITVLYGDSIGQWFDCYEKIEEMSVAAVVDTFLSAGWRVAETSDDGIYIELPNPDNNESPLALYCLEDVDVQQEATEESPSFSPDFDC